MKDSKNPVSKRSALLLLHTPLQAWIAEQVLRDEAVSNYDLVYFTQNNSSEDRYYFGRLSTKADNAKYCFAPKRQFDIFCHLDFRRQAKSWYQDKGHDLTVIASIDAHVGIAISNRQMTSELVTFDDGLANITLSDPYHVDRIPWRSRLYRKLLGASDLLTIKNRIARHYTLYPQFENIVEPSRLKTLQGWSRDQGVHSPRVGATKTYFLGQPFKEVMSATDINTLEKYIKTLGIDIYVRHPRENSPLELSSPYLDKKGRIAEDAIVHDAGNCQVHVIGWFSTALFNLGAVAQRRTALLLRKHPESSRMADMARKVGCEVVFL